MELIMVTGLDQWNIDLTGIFNLISRLPLAEFTRIKQSITDDETINIPNCVKESTIAWLLVFYRLIRHNNLPVDIIRRTDEGKPYIYGFPFNLSHDYPNVALLVDRINFSNNIGIDLVRLDINYAIHELRSMFDPIEWFYILQDRTMFPVFWSLKESYVKAIGSGLNVEGGLCSVVFHFRCAIDDENVWVSPLFATHMGKRLDNFYFYTIRYTLIHNGMVISLCSQYPIKTLNIQIIDTTSFVNQILQ